MIGVALAAVLLSIALPYINIPRSQLLPPALVYGEARGKTSGVVTNKRTRGAANPFKVGTKVYLVDYQFIAKAPAMLRESRPGTAKTYRGTVRVDQGSWNGLAPGSRIPIRYEPTYPTINGIDLAWGGRSEAQGSGLFSGWMLWALAAVFLGYMFTPLLERILPRGDI